MNVLSLALSSRTARLLGVLLGLWLLLSLSPDTSDAFLSAGNFSNLTAQVAEVVIIGVGMTLVILIGGIDLSVGAGMALSGVIAAKLQIDLHQGAAVAILAALLCGAVVGLWHGVLVSRLGVPPFVATLSGFLAYRGLALVLSDARGLSPMGADFLLLGGRLPQLPTKILCLLPLLIGAPWLLGEQRSRRRHGLSPQPAAFALGLLLVPLCAALLWIYKGGLPVPVLLGAVAVALGGLLLSRTRFGRYARAIGGNSEAARLCGVPVARVTLLCYLLTGLLTAAAGLVLCARTNGVTPGNAGLMRELHVITAVVIGGTSLQGGSGTMVGTLIGALLFGTLGNGMNLLGVSSNWQLIFTGGILLCASLIDALSSRRRD